MHVISEKADSFRTKIEIMCEYLNIIGTVEGTC